MRRFPSLPDDLETVKKAVIELRHLKNINNMSTFEIPGCVCNMVSFWKIKKFACKSLKGRGNQSGIRVIYTWCPSTQKVVWFEIYYKSDKENENKDRIKNYLGSVPNIDRL